YLFTGWTPEIAETVTDDVIYTATWQRLETIILHIYMNGDTSKPVKSVYLPGVIKGERLEISTIDINDTCVELAGEGYTFEGFYADGGWRQYKLGNKTCTLGEYKQILGWTNLYCMITGKAADEDTENETTEEVTEDTTEGTTEEVTEGTTEETTEGVTEETTEGTTEEATEEVTEGTTEEATEGATEGTTEGATEGTTQGAGDTANEGAAQG
ncbi:MAG: hypothetical protein ACI4R6_06940, partial [Lachnospiraceae bacterium]